MPNNQRIVYLDILRVAACCMVILMHSPAPEAGVPGYVQVPLYFLTAAGLVLFFMVSGALLLPIRSSTISFLKRRLGKVLGPWMIWTFFYMFVDLSFDDLSISELCRLFVSVSSPSSHVMWFMYALVGLYLLSPIISPFIKSASKKEVDIYILLWFITLCTPWFTSFLKLNLEFSSPLYYFSGYVGYFILGYYLHTYGSKLHTKFLPLLILIPLCCLLIFKACGGEGLGSLFWYLSVFVALMSIAWFEGARRLKIPKRIKCGWIITELSNCSFGIYLMHIFIMRKFLWNIDFIIHGFGWPGQIVMTWALTFILSYLLTKIISFIPYSEYIVGFKHKRQ